MLESNDKGYSGEVLFHPGVHKKRRGTERSFSRDRNEKVTYVSNISNLGRRSVVGEHRQALVWSYIIARCHNILHIVSIHRFGGDNR